MKTKKSSPCMEAGDAVVDAVAFMDSEGMMGSPGVILNVISPSCSYILVKNIGFRVRVFWV